ncbi:MAG TPA: Asp-tRNA(Asn)/Glu-tRNA(Gln) amidotransferase subunit GatC [Gemmataceae bacterium]|nr:Asp-tRNA(Asn)/Glu-tRNA(Gln) amidotransferase subunit GatC [Gemmataceae bacterium]
MSLTPEQVRWVAHLARLELDDAEVQEMARQLSRVVEYVDQLGRVNTDGVEPLAHPLPVHNVFRADEPAPCLPVDAVLANAPDRQGDFYGVPAVLD